MILYNENKEKISFKTNNKIGGETYGDVYKISETECLKIYKNSNSVNKKILTFIKNLHLKNYYEIYNLYNNKSGEFKAHTMKYYKKEEIDILTMPTEYTIDNISRIQHSIEQLTQNNIAIVDTHTGNIIMDSNNITIIDIDLYTFNRFYTSKKLETKNIEILEFLFREIFAEAILNYHSEYKVYKFTELIKDIFKLSTPTLTEETFKELARYKYPIDYIKKKVRQR